MARQRKKPKGSLSIEMRFVRWLLVTFLWRLPRSVLRLLSWSMMGLIRIWQRKPDLPDTSDAFYRSYRWRKLRVATLEANRLRYGMLACECCGMVDVASFHVDHIYPRSSHPELALDPDNLQVLCDHCNIGKGTSFTTNWRGGRNPEPKQQRGWKRFFARS